MDKNKIIVYTDGGARGNPGPAAIGSCMFINSKLEFSFASYIGNTTNNIAEYTAILESLVFLSFYYGKEKLRTVLLIRSDSYLVVQQLSGRFAIKDLCLKQLWLHCKQIERSFIFPVVYSFVPRDKNTIADSLVNLALDTKEEYINYPHVLCG